jgi:hypothetical protein
MSVIHEYSVVAKIIVSQNGLPLNEAEFKSHSSLKVFSSMLAGNFICHFFQSLAFLSAQMGL